MQRSVSASLGVVLGALVLVVAVVILAARVRDRLFPVVQEHTPGLAPVELTVEDAHRALDQALVAAGGDLPARTAAGDAAVIALPQGLAPETLQTLLRKDPRLAGAEVYVTRADVLLWRARIFAGGAPLLVRDLRPFLLASPPHPPGNPPELVVLIDARQGGEAEQVLEWSSPVTLILPPFGPTTLRLDRDAARASQGIVAALSPLDDPLPQIDAVPHAGAVFLDATVPDDRVAVLLAELERRGMALIDGCPAGCVTEAALARHRLDVLRVTGRLQGDPAHAVSDGALLRNLAVQWGYGVVVAPGTEAGLAQAEEFVAAARADGIGAVFVEEAARAHGRAPPR